MCPRPSRRDDDPVRLPATALAVVGVLGLLLAVAACVLALTLTRAPAEIPALVLVTVLVCCVLPSALSLAGALAALRRGSYRLALVGSVASWAALHTTILGIAVGIWLFVVLNRADVRASFRDGAPRARGRIARPGMDFVAANAPDAVAFPVAAAPPARAPTTAPAVFMTVCGALGVLLWGFALSQPTTIGEDPPPGLLLLAELVVSGFVVAGGVAMARRRTWELAVAGAVLLLVSCVCALPGIPVGIWSLVVLLRPEVRAAFRDAEKQPARRRPGR